MSDSEELSKLAQLHAEGALSSEEFARAKARLLGASPGASQGAGQGASGGPRPASLKAFRRARVDRWLGGVCGGLGEFTDVPAWMWRFLFTLLALTAGSGVLVYVLLWIFVPAD